MNSYQNYKIIFLNVQVKTQTFTSFTKLIIFYFETIFICLSWIKLPSKQVDSSYLDIFL